FGFRRVLLTFRARTGWLGSCRGSAGEFRAGLLVCRRESATSIARTTEKPGPMPADDGLRLDDHQGVQNAGCKPIKAPENEQVEIAENKPFRRFSSQHIKLVAQRHNLCLERSA